MGVQGQRVVVLGLGRSGQAAARLANALGAGTVIGVDQNLPGGPVQGVSVVGNDIQEGWLDEHTRVIVSPGIAAGHEWIERSLARGAVVQGELAFAAEQLTMPVVAVTGTNGKSTVTHLTGQLLASCGHKVFVGGNIGVPLSEALTGEVDCDVVVAEVSSYQLEWSEGFSPSVAVILNLTPDHLARHGTMEGYAAAKMKIFEGLASDGLGILPWGEALLEPAKAQLGDRGAFVGKLPGVVVDGTDARVQLAGQPPTSLSLARLPLPGRHNQLNAATAVLMAHALGAPLAELEGSIGSLSGLAHRMEVLGTYGDVCWVNDSKATNLDAAEVAIRGIPQTSVVLLGGKAKGEGFVGLVPWLERHRAVVTFGASGEDVANELLGNGLEVHRATDLADAVSKARDLAEPGDAVLLSPGGASFDEFQDFEHRGRVFRGLVTGRGEACRLRQ
jgi:UDP-N-acetylmuramoylalanine--D-glutamate ligase